MAARPRVPNISVVSINTLPLYASEEELAHAVLGPDRAPEWKSIAALLETRGLPKIDALMGGRYVPAVKAFFDREHGLQDFSPLTPDGFEELGSWKKRRKQPV